MSSPAAANALESEGLPTPRRYWVLASVLPAFDSPQNPILQLDVQHPSTPLGITTFDVTVTDRAGATGTVTYQLVNDGHTSLPGTY